jgi:alanyl aminopeptidase
MTVDARPTSSPVHKPVESDADAMEGLFIAYAKGRAVLAMVEQWVGPEAFRRGVLDYLAAHAWGNAAGEDLWAALSKASGADVTGALRTFVDQPGLPLVEVEVGAGGAVVLRQRRFLNAGVSAPGLSWRVPVVLKYQSGAGVRTRSVLLAEPERRLDLGGEVAWVMPNAGARGYYRWRVPAAMLLELAGRSAEALDPRERIAFLSNAGALLDAGVLGGADYLRVLNAFAADAEPEVLAALLDGLEKVRLSFVPDALRDAFAAFVRSTLAPARERFGLAGRPGEAESAAKFRPRLVAWLGDAGGDPAVRRRAAELARAYRSDPASIDPSLAEVALRLAAIDGDRDLFDAYRRSFEESRVPADRDRYLEALGAFRRPEVRAAAMAYALAGPLRPHELFTIPGALADTEEGHEAMYAWATSHYAEIAARIPPDFVAYLPFIAGGCSPDRLERARAFFAAPEHRVDGTDRQLAKVAEQVGDCANLRRREGGEVAEYLRRFPGSPPA